ncbi:hypothetical protein HaLaN_24899 [Haematococcus lacustris]|uniref:Uncharacterized protein n=1 Tax=Haematococcus lacustris TaxID=44745 RepID=A0A699ZV02_HAELA|nr:hypothetical protein HaLaN_24899 [Haematococcus lacustris]
MADSPSGVFSTIITIILKQWGSHRGVSQGEGQESLPSDKVLAAVLHNSPGGMQQASRRQGGTGKGV